MTFTLVDLVRHWAAFVGLMFDILGAVLVYVGVRISLEQAASMEETHQVRLFDDIGDPEILRKNEALADARARERVRASRWAGVGLICFVIGFSLQAVGAWPK